MEKIIKACELQEGEGFKMEKSQRKFRVCMGITYLKGKNIPDFHKGKILVVFDNCRQWITDPSTEVIVEKPENFC